MTSNSKNFYFNSPLDYIHFDNVILDTFHYPISGPLDHTMGMSLDEWAKQKMPLSEIKTCAEQQIPIEIHGIYPTEFSRYASIISYKVIQEIKFKHNPSEKAYNYIRPSFIWALNKENQKRLIVAVTPGRDYILQYAGLLRHTLSLFTRNYSDLLSIYRYPRIEGTISEWSSLNDAFIKENDIVIIGFVNEVENIFLNNKYPIQHIGTENNQFYTSKRYKLENKMVINFLGVKYSFWGCISAQLAKKIAFLKSRTLIYIGKLGSLNDPDYLYTKIYSPTTYAIFKYITPIVKRTMENPFVHLFPELDTDLHVSVPTVAEEDLIQRKLLYDQNASSIDNEISQIANAIWTNNKKNPEYPTSFFAVHFATDYLRNSHEINLETHLDLSNNRTKHAKKYKSKILKSISKYLWHYLNQSTNTHF